VIGREDVIGKKAIPEVELAPMIRIKIFRVAEVLDRYKRGESSEL
jgi:hypothetical protein